MCLYLGVGVGMGGLIVMKWNGAFVRSELVRGVQTRGWGWDERAGGRGEIRSVRRSGGGVVSRDYFGACVCWVGKHWNSILFVKVMDNIRFLTTASLYLMQLGRFPCLRTLTCYYHMNLCTKPGSCGHSKPHFKKIYPVAMLIARSHAVSSQSL